MAQIKISQLEELTSVSDNDVFASVDTDNSKTKKTKASTLKKYVKENLNYSEVAGKPSINGTELLGDKSLQDLGIQPAGDYALNSALKSYSLITETGNKISLTINSSTYVMTLQLKDKNGSVLSTGTIDLPLETMVVGASYNADTQEIELTLKNDSTHRLVTDTEKATWNNKVDKVEGKGLSTNDFTNELKNKLDGIEDNAQVNKIEKISLDGVEQEIVEKEVNIKSYDINKYFYNALTYNNTKGNDLTFEDSIEFPLGKLDMDGKSEQVTTTGTNKIGLKSNNAYGVTVTLNDDGSITVKGTANRDGVNIGILLESISLKANTPYIFKVEDLDISNPDRELQFITTSNYLNIYQTQEASSMAAMSSMGATLTNMTGMTSNYNEFNQSMVQNSSEQSNKSVFSKMEQIGNQISKHSIKYSSTISPRKSQYFYFFFEDMEKFPISVKYKNLNYQFTL